MCAVETGTRLERAAASLWAPEAPYLNTASFGLPPAPAFEALQAALEDWRHGRTTWEPWHLRMDEARERFAGLVGVRAADVAVGTTVSGLLALVASALPDGSRVVVPEIEFTSNLFPWMVHADRGVEVRTVPLSDLADAVDERTTLVAVSAVQSATGEVADLAALAEVAERAGALLAVDATQAVGWLPVDASMADFVVCHGYKWLMSPRGAAFLTVRPDRLGAIRPLAAGWTAGEVLDDTYYGPPLRLAESTKRLDVSPAWFSWVGTAESLRVIEDLGVPAIRDHDVSLANRFRQGLGLPPGDSAIVSVDIAGAEERLAAAGILASVRAGSLRASFHVYNTDADVDAAVRALRD
jgi:selenocysteine lyase/cysteine desulfurase